MIYYCNKKSIEMSAKYSESAKEEEISDLNILRVLKNKNIKKIKIRNAQSFELNGVNNHNFYEKNLKVHNILQKKIKIKMKY